MRWNRITRAITVCLVILAGGLVAIGGVAAGAHGEVPDDTVVVGPDGVLIKGSEAEIGDPTANVETQEGVDIRVAADNNVETAAGINVATPEGTILWDDNHGIVEVSSGRIISKEVTTGTFKYSNTTTELETGSGNELRTGQGTPVANSEPYNEAYVTVSITETDPSVVGAGQNVTVEAELENRGHAHGNRTVSLFAGDDPEPRTTKSVDIGAGSTESVSLTYMPYTFDVPEQPLTVATIDDSDSTTVTIKEPRINVSVTSTNVDGGDLTVKTSVTRVGALAPDGTALRNETPYVVEFHPTIGPGTTKSVTLGPGDTATPSFSTTLSDDDPDRFPVTVRVGTFADSITIDRSPTPQVTPTTINTSSPVEAAGPVTVNATFATTTDESAKGSASLVLNGSKIATRTIAAPPTGTTKQFQITAPDSAGNYTLTARTQAGTTQTELTVTNPGVIATIQGWLPNSLLGYGLLGLLPLTLVGLLYVTDPLARFRSENSGPQLTVVNLGGQTEDCTIVCTHQDDTDDTVYNVTVDPDESVTPGTLPLSNVEVQAQTTSGGSNTINLSLADTDAPPDEVAVGIKNGTVQFKN